MSNWTKLMDRSPPRVQLLLRGHLVTLENVLKALSDPIAGSYHGFEPNRPISHAATAQEQEHEEEGQDQEEVVVFNVPNSY